MKILIGYDGSTYADVALDDLRRGGLPDGVEAVVVSVGEGLAEPASSVSDNGAEAQSSSRGNSASSHALEGASRSLAMAWEVAERGSRRVRSHFPNWDVSARAFSTEPAQMLLQEAGLWKADLILVGSRGLSTLGRLFLGSVSKTVAASALCSVRVARRARRKVSGSVGLRIIVGVDGSAGAARAVRAVGMRPWPLGTEVRLIAVDDGSDPVRIRDVSLHLEELVTGFDEKPPINARLMAEGARAVLLAEGLNASVEIMEGDPWRVLVEEGRKWKSDTLFVGARGRESETEEPGLGSVSTKLVTGAHCSVELVR
jgi:nucleotide-binding universal stress UspA family protein